MGAHEVFDISDGALEEHLREATGGEGADLVIVGPGTVSAMESAAACVASGGTIMLFTPLPEHEIWPLPVHDLYFKDVTVTTSYSAGPVDTREALDLLAAGLDVRPLFTHRFTLDGVVEAYRLVAEARDALKVIVYPSAVGAVNHENVVGQASLAQPL
jgi:L-iditol 2-dehydrogenase